MDTDASLFHGNRQRVFVSFFYRQKRWSHVGQHSQSLQNPFDQGSPGNNATSLDLPNKPCFRATINGWKPGPGQ
jgi:hypothetical protein